MGAFSSFCSLIERRFLALCPGGARYSLVPGAEAPGGVQSGFRTAWKILVYLLLFGLVSVGAIGICKEYIGPILKWLATVSGWHGVAVYTVLFVAVSFPFIWGYMILNVGAGYLYGVLRGVALTSLSALVGSVVAFVACRAGLKRWTDTIHKRFSNFKQLSKIVSGDQGFKITMMTRLTPVPFGIQNALFAMTVAMRGLISPISPAPLWASDMTLHRFALATFVGLLPTQFLNAYMGTTLRSLDDVLAGRTSPAFLVGQVVMMLWVTWYVNNRMKKEVSLACERELLTHGAGHELQRSASDHDLVQQLLAAEEGSGTASPTLPDGEEMPDEAENDDSSTAAWLAHVTTDTLMSKPFADTFRLYSGRDRAGSRPAAAAETDHAPNTSNHRRAHSADWSKDIAGGVPRHNGGGHKYTAALETIKVAHSDSDFGATRDDTAAKLGTQNCLLVGVRSQSTSWCTRIS